MESRDFDRLARALGQTTGRRAALAGLVSGVAGLALGQNALAAKKDKNKPGDKDKNRQDSEPTNNSGDSTADQNPVSSFRVPVDQPMPEAPPTPAAGVSGDRSRGASATGGAEAARKCKQVGASCDKKKDTCCGSANCKGKKCKCAGNACFIKNLGRGRGSGSDRFNTPYGVAVDPRNGTIFVADTFNYRIQKFDKNGKYDTQWGQLGDRNSEFRGPVSVAVDPTNSDVFVVDDVLLQVKRFNNNGTFVASWGFSGSKGKGGFVSPFGIYVDRYSKVFVTDRGSNLVQKFNNGGGFETQFNGTENNNNYRLQSPTGIVQIGNSYFVADLKPQIEKFSLNLRGEDRTSDRMNQIYGLAEATGNRVLAVDSGAAKVLQFDNNLRFDSAFGKSGSGDGEMNRPYAVATYGKTVYVADTYNHRIQVWEVK